MDKIQLKNLKFYGFHGVLPEEKRLGQQFIINVTLEIDLTESGKTDDLLETISYADIFEIVEQEVTKQTYDLIEKLCYRLVGLILAFDSRIHSAQVEVQKPNAPINGQFDYASVNMKRAQDEIDLSEFRL